MRNYLNAAAPLLAGLILAVTGCAPGDAAEAATDAAGQANQARYRVREQLVGLDLPNDAVGVTDRVTGAITPDAEGEVIPGQSTIVVDLTRLKSDEDRRDGYVQRRLLETAQFPTVQLQALELGGLSLPLPQSGSRTFELIGDLRVRGETRPTTWRVEAHFDPERITGTAATAFTFDEFGLKQPRVPVVLSVADTIRLEYDFTLVAVDGGTS